jgi:phosphoribosylformylglycinamidine cyclo-ligase
MSYKDAGVNLDAAAAAKQQMAQAVAATHTSAVLAGMGAFGGCLDLGTALHGLREPVLVATTDGVGTKTLLAARLGSYASVGHDLVNHCVNDLLAQGARPLFFMDYFAAARLEPAQVAAVVGGAAAACRRVGCVLLGGETAEMPQVYLEGAFDLAGTMVGLVERADLLPREVHVGDAILALPSSGLHTNGYSLARRVVESTLGYDACPPELGGQMIGAALLDVHRPYLLEVTMLRRVAWLRGLAHITGGGVYENLPRALPPHAGARLTKGSWRVPPIFALLQRLGNIGLGMLAIVAADDVADALDALPVLRRVGEVVAWDGKGERVVVE